MPTTQYSDHIAQYQREQQQIRRQLEHKLVNQFNQKPVMTPIKHTKRDIVEAVVLTLIVGVILVASILIGE